MSEKGNSPILVVLIIIAVVCFGWLLFQVGRQFIGVSLFSGTTSPNQAPTSNPTAPESTSSADMTDWKTYTNEIHGFTLEYPSNWIINKANTEDAVIHIGNNGTTISIFPYSNPDAGKFNVKVIKKENIMIGSEPMTFNYYSSTVTNQLSAYTDLNSSRVVGKKFRNINFYLDKMSETSDLNIIKQILSTFKFTQ